MLVGDDDLGLMDDCGDIYIYPNLLKGEVGGSIRGCEISSLL